MMAKSLDQFKKLRTALVIIRKRLLRRVGVDLHDTVNISMTSRFVCRSKGAIRVGSETYVAFKTLLVSYDPLRGSDVPIVIGSRCFIGGGSLICPGVRVGDECIVAAGSVVVADVPDRSIVAGNPARVVRSEIEVGPFGRLAGADERSRSLPRV